MKKLLAIAVLIVIALAIAPRLAQGQKSVQREEDVPAISIVPYGEGNTTAFAVVVDMTKGADEAIVVACYWTQNLGIGSKIVLCKNSIIPVVPGSAVVTDAVPAPQSEIYSVDVRLVHDVYERRFVYKETPSAQGPPPPPPCNPPWCGPH